MVATREYPPGTRPPASHLKVMGDAVGHSAPPALATARPIEGADTDFSGLRVALGALAPVQPAPLSSWPSDQNAETFATDLVGSIMRMKPSDGEQGFSVVTGNWETGRERVETRSSSATTLVASDYLDENVDKWIPLLATMPQGSASGRSIATDLGPMAISVVFAGSGFQMQLSVAGMPPTKSFPVAEFFQLELV